MPFYQNHSISHEIYQMSAMEEEQTIVPFVQKQKHGSKINILIDRPVFNQARFDEGYEAFEQEPPSLSEKAYSFLRANCHCNRHCLIQCIMGTFPILRWLPKYSLRERLLGDIIAGFTVAIMHIPQGMAYGLLAGLPAVFGLYVSFFPVLIYSIMGTSRHISIGTFAVASLMILKVISHHGIIDDSAENSVNSSSNRTQNISTSYLNEVVSINLGIATAVTLLAGIFQLTMGLLRMGFITIYLSDQLVSGFTTGAAVHVACSQLKNLFGVKLATIEGPIKIIYIAIDFFSKILDCNPATVIISLVCIIIMIITKDFINPLVKDKLKMPIPIELFLVILGTVASYFGKFDSQYNVKTVGYIPTGLPYPAIPNISILGKVAGDSFAIAMVCFAISISLAKILAKKRSYDLNPDQELIAMGSSSIFSSFFSCYPSSASLSRSMVQEAVGGQTQLTGLISCALLLVVLLAIGPLFEPLPNAVLSSIIVVNLKGLFLQFKELKTLWYISLVDFMIWIVSFLAVTLIDLALGLGLSVGFALLTVVVRAQRPHTCLLGRLKETDIYKDIQVYKTAEQIPGIKIFRFESSLFFANAEYFRNKIYFKTGINPRTLLSQRNKILKRQKNLQEQHQRRSKSQERRKPADKLSPASEELSFTKRTREQVEPEEDNSVLEEMSSPSIHHIVIDCAGFTYLDTTGVYTLIQVIEEYKRVDITVFLSNCRMNIRHMLNVTGFFDKVSQDNLYVTVHDAVLCASTGPYIESIIPQDEEVITLNIEKMNEDDA